MGWIAAIALVLWALFGDPSKDVANWFWEYEVAPWENVDAYYYPNRSDLSVHVSREDVGSLDGCREWVYAEATQNNEIINERLSSLCIPGPWRL